METNQQKTVVSASPHRLWPWLVIILAAAAALRVACFLAAPASLSLPPDSVGYLDTARGLLEHGRFGVDVPDVNRTPGYPLFCSVGLALADWRGIIGLQIFLDCLTTVGVFCLGRSLAGGRVGLVSAGVYAASPLSVVLACQVLTETLFLAVLVPSLWLAVAVLHRPGRGGGVVALGALSAGLLMIRPAAMVFVAAVIAAWLWRAAALTWRGRSSADETPASRDGLAATKRSEDGLRWLVRAGMYVAVVSAAVLPWCVRNERAAGYFGLSGQGPVTYARDWAGLVQARVEGVSLEQARAAIWHDILQRADAADEQAPPFDPAAMVRRRLYPAMRAEARAVLTRHAGLFAREHLSQSFLALAPPTEPLHLIGADLGEKNTRTVLSQQGVWAAIRYYFENRTDAMLLYAAVALATLALYVFAARGLWRLTRRGGWSAVAVLLTVFAAANFFAGGIATVPRYFLPLLPLVAIAAAIGVTRVTDNRL
ncbi:MAG: glycosyltransferase family 39 protein [Phycisphaerae bacterium]|nr:glycosyltransferase family 39 protein [Phycisphaerae bacterium]